MAVPRRRFPLLGHPLDEHRRGSRDRALPRAIGDVCAVGRRDAALVSASAFFPFTVGGAGVREAAFAALYGTVGVPEATAYAASLSFWATQLISAGVGGVINLFVPLSGTERD
ncbi:MAG: hypothetical protein EP303_07170 [Deltaproteobacteria bacterium]|nr:MAG: hypothetical protein EP303_07170 [Deltaproteobacteria bacterium]